MEYKFKKYDINSSNISDKNKEFEYSIDYDSLNKNEKPLYHFGSRLWTPQKIQELIDESIALEGTEELEYQVEGGHLGIIVTKTDGIAFFDLTNREKEEEDFIWAFDKFIEFLQDFKKFVQENY